MVRRAILMPAGILLLCAGVSHADTLTLTSGSNATTTPNVATAITGFQIVGNAASTTPVKLYTTNGTLTLGTTSGLTFDGASSGSVIYFSGTVANINAALATLRYTRATTGTDTLEVSLVNRGEVFFTDNSHLYKFITGSYSWTAASSSAGLQTAYGATGYLATITSSAENDFIKARLTGDGWIGAADTAVEGDWRWMTGPEAGTLFWRGTGGGSAQGGNYANWNAGEPNQSGEEDCAETYVASGKWNDLPCSQTLGYVVEFGAPGNMPTVVARNISIVTADVPAVTSLSPSNGATGVSPTANLTIGFSKSVTPQTGSVLVRRSSDDGVVATVDVSGAEVSGGDTSSITIDPAAPLPEGTQLYVTVPSTAFRDGSSNYFDGIASSTTWVFTTADITPPAISAIATSTATTSATITWTTDEAASTRVWYSADASFASSTAERDTSPRVTSHSISVSNLVACTLYAYRVVSRDTSGNSATSTSSTFVTSGCPGSVVPASSTSTPITVSATSTASLTEQSRTMRVTTPSDFTATSSSIVIQIKGFESASVLGSIGRPSDALTSAAPIVFNITALIDNATVLDSFAMPVTVSYTYTDADIAGLDESTLSMYHYRDGSWQQLDRCSVDATANTITCDAPHFSIFAIFGTPPVVTAARTQAGSTLPWCSGPSAPGWDSNLPDGGCTRSTAAPAATTQSAAVPTEAVHTAPLSAQGAAACPGYTFTRTLRQGSRGEDVRALQRLLNCLGFRIAETGPGAPGEESGYFRRLTREAVVRFQEAYAADILAPVGEDAGTGVFAEYSRLKLTGLTQ